MQMINGAVSYCEPLSSTCTDIGVQVGRKKSRDKPGSKIHQQEKPTVLRRSIRCITLKEEERAIRRIDCSIRASLHDVNESFAIT